jgi:hypothetical protein
MADIELQVQILNLTYTLRGFNAIRDLKEWLDQHASDAASDLPHLPVQLETDPQPGNIEVAPLSPTRHG